MAIYKIADTFISINPKSDYVKKQLEDYIVTSEKPDFCIDITQNDIEAERAESTEASYSFCESIAVYRKICKNLLRNYNAIMLHSSALSLDEDAYIFTAPSGTGKSTHTRLWRDAFGDRVVMINDDKPLIREIDGKYYVYGTPWNGKHRISNNIKAPLKGICILKRGKANCIKRVDAVSHLAEILNQTVVPKEEEEMSKLLDFLEKMLRETPVYLMECTPSLDAVKMAYEAMII